MNHARRDARVPRARRSWAALGALAVLGALLPARARAQGTDAQLKQAIALYQDLQVERSLAFLRRVVSPSSPFVVTTEQRVEAYKYLGGSFAIQGQKDSAIVYFTAAIERDPFVELDPQVFTTRERAAFAEAKRHMFALGLKVPAATRIDPASQRVTIPIVTSHDADVRAELRGADGAVAAVLWQGTVGGQREVAWNGVGTDGRLVPAGRYELLVSGRSRELARTDSVRAYLDVRLDHPPLEDTLPALRPEDLLPERHPTSAAARDLVTGLGIAGGALLVRALVPSRALDGDRAALAGGAAAAGAFAGIATFLYGRAHRAIPANIAANRARRESRERAMAGIAARNGAKLAETKVIIAPAAGLAQ